MWRDLGCRFLLISEHHQRFVWSRSVIPASAQAFLKLLLYFSLLLTLVASFITSKTLLQQSRHRFWNTGFTLVSRRCLSVVFGITIHFTVARHGASTQARVCVPQHYPTMNAACNRSPNKLGHSSRSTSRDFADTLRDDRVMELKENTIIVVLGASGDLAKKKTVSSDQPHPSMMAY